MSTNTRSLRSRTVNSKIAVFNDGTTASVATAATAMTKRTVASKKATVGTTKVLGNKSNTAGTSIPPHAGGITKPSTKPPRAAANIAAAAEANVIVGAETVRAELKQISSQTAAAASKTGRGRNRRAASSSSDIVADEEQTEQQPKQKKSKVVIKEETEIVVKIENENAENAAGKTADNVKAGDAAVDVKPELDATAEDIANARQAELQEAQNRADDQGVLHDDLDEEDRADPLMASEYAADIISYTKLLESKTMPNADYMNNQGDLTWKMRGILIDWLIEVHHKFRLLPETLYMAVNIIDRFLSKRIVSLVKLQLVGLAAMVIAAKFEEVVPPSLANFNYMADNGYSEDEIIRAERYILNVLDFELHSPSPMNFLRRSSKADHYDIQNRTLAKYLMEVALVDHRFLKFAPSRVSAAALYLARKMLDKGEWNNNLVYYSGYQESEIEEVSNYMIRYFQESFSAGGSIKHEALYKKYASKKFLKASIFVKDWVARNCSDPSLQE